MQQPWRFVDTGARDAASNMALDEALLVMHEAGATPPTLRVYGWCQPTLSLGYAQNAQQEVDLAACHAQGVAPIRRPTGGRAVLHDQEVTYSVVMPALDDGPHTITEHYRRIGMALAAASGPWVSRCIWRAPRYGLRRRVPASGLLCRPVAL